MKKVLCAVSGAALALVLAGCGVGSVSGTGADAGAASASPSVSESSAPSSGDDASAEPAEEESPAEDDMTVKFGESFAYEDKVVILVSAPKKYTPSDTAAVGNGKNHVVFTVTLKNGSAKPYDPSLFSATAVSGEAEAEQIFDSAKNVGGSPDTKVLPGKRVVFKIAFTVKNPKDITMEASPGFEYENALYTL